MEKLSYLLKKSFNYYDKKNNIYKEFINDDASLDFEKSEITFNKTNKKFKYQMLGCFDNYTNIWFWSWMIPSIENSKTLISKKLLSYGLKINVLGGDTDDLYLRTQLVNSRFHLNDNIQLEIHIALSSYIAKDNFIFLYPIKYFMNKSKTKYVTYYLCITEYSNQMKNIITNNSINNLNMSTMIKESLKYYDETNLKYKSLTNYKNIILDNEANLIFFNEKKYKYELLGVYNKINFIWIWSWMMPSINENKTLLSKKNIKYWFKFKCKIIFIS